MTETGLKMAALRALYSVAVTCMLQLGGVLLHLVLRSSVCDRYHHFGDVSSHSIFKRKGLFVGVFQCHTCSTEEERKTTVGALSHENNMQEQ